MNETSIWNIWGPVYFAGAFLFGVCIYNAKTVEKKGPSRRALSMDDHRVVCRPLLSVHAAWVLLHFTFVNHGTWRIPDDFSDPLRNVPLPL
jgi:hypothetical protein